jgi:outer membrane scaffolding protein for murein synthesis (MipA/OmpV family)
MLSPGLTDHFFSVSAQEAADPRSYNIAAAYDARAIGLAGAAGVSGLWRMGGKWAMITSVEGQVVSDRIADSPLVRDRKVWSVMAGAIYTF